MRLLPFLVSTAITIGLVYALNTKIGPAPPLGKFLSPQHGFWQNAEPANENFSQDLKFPALKGNANVYFDERLIPHVFADISSRDFCTLNSVCGKWIFKQKLQQAM